MAFGGQYKRREWREAGTIIAENPLNLVGMPDGGGIVNPGVGLSFIVALKTVISGKYAVIMAEIEAKCVLPALQLSRSR